MRASMVEQAPFDPTVGFDRHGSRSPGRSSDHAWDVALDRLGGSPTSSRPGLGACPESIRPTSPPAWRQVDRYLARAWFRAGIALQQHDDCTQAVYATLLQGLGRDRFDHLMAEVGQSGIREVLSRETADGPDFFRAIDTVKKRAQRERTLPAAGRRLDEPARESPTRSDWRGVLQEAIQSALNPREAALIQGHPSRRDTRRDRPAVGDRFQDRQQREDPGPSEAPRGPRLRPHRLTQALPALPSPSCSSHVPDHRTISTLL